MAVFPIATDMRRPVPTAGGVGNYRVAQQAMPGLEGAEALNQAGQQNQQIGGMLWNLGEQIDTASAQEALNQIRNKRQELTYDPEKGFQRFKGGAVMKPGPGGKSLIVELPEALDAETQAVASKLLSPRARAMFSQAAAREQQQYKRDMTVYFANETEKFEVATLKDLNLTDMQEITHVFNDPSKVDVLAGNIGQRTRAFYEKRGLPGEAAATAATSDALVGVVKKAIISGDTSAIGLYERYKDKIDAKDQLGLDASIKTMTLGVDASNWYNSNTGGGTATGGHYDNNIGNITVSRFQYSGGKGAPRGSFETFQTPEHGVAAAYGTVTAKAKQNGGSISFSDLIGGNVDRGGKVRGWAPAANGSSDPLLKGNDPASYAARLAASVGLKAGDAVPINDDAKMATILRTMNVHEKGKQTVRDDAFTAGIKLARGDTSAIANKPSSDPLQNSVDKATGEQKPAAPQRTSEDGVVNALKIKIHLEEQKVAMTQAAYADGASPQVIGARLGVIEKQYSHGIAQLQLYKDKLWDAVNDSLKRDPTRMPSADILNQLDPKQVESLERQVNRAIEGKKTVTNNAAWHRIYRGLTSDNANERAMWANTHLEQFAEYLSPNDSQELAKIQGAIRKGDDKHLSRVQTLSTQVNSVLNQMKIKTTGKVSADDEKKAGTFHRVFQNQLNIWESRTGKSAGEQDVQVILDGMVKLVVDGGWFGTDKRVYEITYAEIPEAERNSARVALRRANRPVNERNILELYQTKLLQEGTPDREEQPAMEWPSAWEGAGGGGGSVGAPRPFPVPVPTSISEVRDNYQKAMDRPSEDLATMGAAALRRLLGLE